MPLSRLDNFLKNVRGNVIYVNPNDLDATDSVENQGNSLGFSGGRSPVENFTRFHSWPQAARKPGESTETE